jgi:preprotein translocase subunit SecY|tara:strand:+ start:9921 stop:11273 length:1353 start_codon:yes stop_codon:yes gene_type:complete
MASQRQQKNSNAAVEAFGKAKDLQRRILFVLGVLIVFRMGTHIPIPGIDPIALAKFSQANLQEGILGMLNMFTGGAFARASIFALNIIPYILASIFVQILAKTVPSLQELEKEGEAGKRKINQYTRYLTVGIAMMNGFMLSSALMAADGVVLHPGIGFKLHTALTFTAGAMFVVWMAEQINTRGIGNGASLLIFAGIVAELPKALIQTFALAREGSLSEFALIGLAIMVVVIIAFCVFMESAHRKITVQYPKRQVGARQSGGEVNHMPLKVNLAGVMGPILASQLLLAPSFMLQQFFADSAGSSNVASYIAMYLNPSHWVFNTLFVAGIFIFSFWWVALMMDPEKMAERIKKEGGFVPGIRPGAQTAKYFDKVMTRLMIIGSVYISFICVLPQMVIGQYGVPFYFGGTSLLIVVTVALDSMSRVQAALVAHRYEGLMKKARLRGGRKARI